MNRPRKRLVYVGLRLSDPEAESMGLLASGLGVSKSEFVRDAAAVYELLALAVIRSSERPPSAAHLRAILTQVAVGIEERALQGRPQARRAARPNGEGRQQA